MAFTIERWIVVLFPFKRGDLCTVKKANIVVVSLALFGFIAYNFGIWTATSVQMPSMPGSNASSIPFCYYIHTYRHLLYVMNNIDTVVTLILPSCVIVVLNVQIIRAVTRLNKERHQVLYNSQGCPKHRTPSDSAAVTNHAPLSSTSVRGVCKTTRKDTRASLPQHKSGSCNSTSGRFFSSLNSNVGQNRVTKMLLVVSTIFLLLNLPAHSIRIYFFIVSLIDPSYKPLQNIASLQKLFTYLYYINFSINFFLYSLCGNNFRKALWGLLCSRNRLCSSLSGRQDPWSRSRGLLEGSTREELSLVRKRPAESVLSYDNGKSTMTTV